MFKCFGQQKLENFYLPYTLKKTNPKPSKVNMSTLIKQQAVIKRVITLYEICKIMGIRHTNAKRMAEEIQAKDGFGEVLKISTSNPNNVSIETYSYTKSQALMIGARLDSKNIIVLVNRLEELSKPKTFEEMAKQTILLADKRIKELEHKIQEDKPLTDFGRAISQSSTAVKIGDWVKAVNENGDIQMGRNKAFKWMRDNKYLQKDNIPYQRYIDSGLFEVKEGLVVTDKRQLPTFTTLLTPKGQMYFAARLKVSHKGESDE